MNLLWFVRPLKDHKKSLTGVNPKTGISEKRYSYPQIRPMIDVTAGIIIREGKVLIAQRSKGKDRGLLWELPGGKAQKNESLEECLKRELHEEFGIDIRIEKYFMSHCHSYSDLELILHAFFVSSFAGKIQLFEHINIAWIEPGDYIKYEMAEADLPIMEELLKCQ